MNSAIVADNLKKYFPIEGGILSKPKYVKAVDGTSFSIAKGEAYGLIGESGCGKTTTGRMLLGLVPPTSGRILFEGVDILTFDKKRWKSLRKEMQMIFQDPYSSMNPLFRIRQILREPMVIHNVLKNDEREARVKQLLESVELVPPQNFLDKHPHELSGGQRQRVAMARALVLEPKFIVADEPVANLDVSLRVGILDLMLNLKDKYGFSCLYITHDIAVAKYVCARIGVMYLGKIVEEGRTDDVIVKPLHPYTCALMQAVPRIDPHTRDGKLLIKGGIPSAADIPAGCRFHPRCVYAEEVCRKVEPELREVKPSHKVACHLAEKLS